MAQKASAYSSQVPLPSSLQPRRLLPSHLSIDRWTLLVAVAVIGRLVVAAQHRPQFFLAAIYDDGNYINRADMFVQGSWATRFDELTFIRGPLYPGYLALVSRSGLPLPIADVILQLALSWFLAHEIARTVGRGRAIRAAAFVSLLLVPMAETATGAHVIRDSLAHYVLLFTIAAGLRALRSSRPVVWVPVAVLGAGATTIIREDALWMLPGLLAVVAVTVQRSIALRRWLPAVGIVALSAVAYAGPRAVVTELNARSGLDAPTLFDDASFVRAHQALARYSNDGTENPFAFTTPMLDGLIARSPSMARISPWFGEWRRDGVMYVDAMRFGLMRGLDLSGVIADPAERTAVLEGIATEVGELCRVDGRPACDAFAGPPPIPVVRVGDVVHAVTRPLTGWEQLLMVEGPPAAIQGENGTVAQLRAWERIINTSPRPDSFRIEGDLVAFGTARSTVGSVLESGYLWLSRIVSPIVRVAGLVALLVLIGRRRWGLASIGLVLFGTAWIRASQVALATRFRIGDYDFHYVQPAAVTIHALALVCVLALVPNRSRPEHTQTVNSDTERG
jgi:hypothetical protein